MKNNNSRQTDHDRQDETPVKKKNKKTLADHSPAVANTVTDTVKNTASVTEGLNTENTDKNTLEPGTR